VTAPGREKTSKVSSIMLKASKLLSKFFRIIREKLMFLDLDEGKFKELKSLLQAEI